MLTQNIKFKFSSTLIHSVRFCSYFSIFIILIISIGGCKKFVEIPPPRTQLVDAIVFTGDGTANAAIDGVYSRMYSTVGFASGGSSSISYLAALSADELVYYISDEIRQFYENTLIPENGTLGTGVWNEIYNYIYTANAIIEGLEKSTGVSSEVKQRITGEAEFIRAFCNFYLVNLFGDVPLVVVTDYKINSTIARSSQQKVYQQIISDLKDAQSLLPTDFSYAEGERIRPTKWAATALLARTYLYTGDWVNAENEATSIINNTTDFEIIGNLDSVFLKNSPEAIWQLKPVIPGLNTLDALFFIITGSPTVSLSESILNSFETGDKRANNWIGTFTVNAVDYKYPYKYKLGPAPTVEEYSMILRLAEQYLIRAEARLQQNNLEDAKSDLNVIRNRAGLSNVTSDDKSVLQTSIEQERRVELFTEWGHRWFDLKRTGRANTVLSAKSGWQSTDQLYPIPRIQISNDPNVTQNPGY